MIPAHAGGGGKLMDPGGKPWSSVVGIFMKHMAEI